MKFAKAHGLSLLAALCLAGWAQAQVGVNGAGPAGAGAAANAGAAGEAAGAAGNIWSKICLTPEQRAACNEKFCRSPFGKLFANALKPMSLATGGLTGECCPVNGPKASDLKKPAESSEGAAARIKKDEAEAKARREAVRYLGTVDCRHWPEAKEALINALRGDKNECVRWEAAIALQRGCCCNQETVEALTIVVEGTDKDGKPVELSERVREAAIVALSMCAIEAKVEPVVETPPPAVIVVPKEGPKEGPREPLKEGEIDAEKKDNGKKVTSPKDYYRNLHRVPVAQTMSNAKRVLAQVRAKQNQVNPITGAPIVAARPAHDGVLGVIGQALAESPKSQAVPSNAPLVPVASPSPTIVPVSGVQSSPAATIVAPRPMQAPVEKKGLLYNVFPGLRGDAGRTVGPAAGTTRQTVQAYPGLPTTSSQVGFGASKGY